MLQQYYSISEKIMLFPFHFARNFDIFYFYFILNRCASVCLSYIYDCKVKEFSFTFAAHELLTNKIHFETSIMNKIGFCVGIWPIWSLKRIFVSARIATEIFVRSTREASQFFCCLFVHFVWSNIHFIKMVISKTNQNKMKRNEKVTAKLWQPNLPLESIRFVLVQWYFLFRHI